MNIATLQQSAPWPDAGVIGAIAAKEIRDSLRNRWFILNTTAFTVLAMALSFMSLAGTGSTGLAGFGRTTASLVNLVTLIVPLMALTAGASSLANERERGTLGYLLAMPVNRFEVLVGKYLGLAAALLASLALGFGVSAAVIAWRTGSTDVNDFIRLVALAYVLSLAMLSVGFLISALARRTGVASAAALFVWLALVFVGDLGLMGGTIAFKLDVQQLFHFSLVNPLQVFKFASLGAIHASLDVLGPAGLYATQTYGESLALLFGGALVAWIVLPLVAALLVFKLRGAP